MVYVSARLRGPRAHHLGKIGAVEALLRIFRDSRGRIFKSLERIATAFDMRVVRGKQHQLGAGLFDDPSHRFMRIRRELELTAHIVRSLHGQGQARLRTRESLLRDVEAPIVGAVLNAVNLRRHEYNYYHYYYYKKEGYAPLGDSDEAALSAAPPN